MQRFKSLLFQKKTSAIRKQSKRKADINKEVKRANENTSMCVMLVQKQSAGEKNKHFLVKWKKNKEKKNLQSDFLPTCPGLYCNASHGNSSNWPQFSTEYIFKSFVWENGLFGDKNVIYWQICFNHKPIFLFSLQDNNSSLS